MRVVEIKSMKNDISMMGSSAMNSMYQMNSMKQMNHKSYIKHLNQLSQNHGSQRSQCFNTFQVTPL